MALTHPGFPGAGLDFLGRLARNNTTAWFRDHKAEYESLVKQPFLELAEAVNAELKRFAPAYCVKLPKGVSRPNRDTRFSKDKSPYKTDISVVLPRNGLEKHLAAGFFIRVRADGADIIGGSVVPGPDELARLRAFIAAKPADFTRLITAPTLRRVMGDLRGERLQRVPKEFAADHPAAEYLRFKQFYFERALPRTTVASSRLVTEVVAGFKAMTPFVEALDRALGNR